MASDDARKQSLALAKLAEQAERYEGAPPKPSPVPGPRGALRRVGLRRWRVPLGRV
jgi:hypothetical protein